MIWALPADLIYRERLNPAERINPAEQINDIRHPINLRLFNWRVPALQYTQWFYKLINVTFQDLKFPIRRMKWAKYLSGEVCFRKKVQFFPNTYMLGLPTECVHTLLQRLSWPSILCN